MGSSRVAAPSVRADGSPRRRGAPGSSGSRKVRAGHDGAARRVGSGVDSSDQRDQADHPLPWGTAQGVGDDYRPGSVAFPAEPRTEGRDGTPDRDRDRA